MIAITRTNHTPSDMMPPTEQPLQTHVTKFDTSDNLQSDLVLRDIKTCFRISPQLCQNQIKSKMTVKFWPDRQRSYVKARKLNMIRSMNKVVLSNRTLERGYSRKAECRLVTVHQL